LWIGSRPADRSGILVSYGRPALVNPRMFLLLVPIAIIAIVCLIWSLVRIIKQTRTGAPIKIRDCLFVFCSLTVLDGFVCLFLIISAGLGHSVDSGSVAPLKCVISFIIVSVIPSTALLLAALYYNARGLPEKARKSTRKKLLVSSGICATVIICATFVLWAEAGGLPLIMYAVRNHHRDLALYLVNRGANLNVTDRFGWSPLTLAIAAKNRELTELLLARDIDVNVHGKKGAVLLWTAMNNDTDLAVRLVKRGVEVDPPGNEVTPLMWAAHKNYVEFTRILIESGANINRKTPVGTALHYAALNNAQDAAMVLLEHGANPDLPTSSGQTPLMAAAANGYLEMAQLLISYQANVNVRTYDNKTALKAAKDNSELRKLLIESGAME
jgi:ankyrin repeat protein